MHFNFSLHRRQLFEIVLCYGAPNVLLATHPAQIGVVNDDNLTVFTHMYIKLEQVHAFFNCFLERIEGVLGAFC